jgi:lysophospholipase L1-like esterase
MEPPAFSSAHRCWRTNFESLINYVAEGDSITRGTYSGLLSYANLVNEVSGGLHRGNVVNLAVGSSQVTGLQSRAATTDTYLQSGQRVNVLSVLIGVNDQVSGGLSTSTFLTNFASYCDSRRAAGWKVVVATLLPGTETALINSGFEAWRQTVNTALRGWVGSHCDAVADFAASSIMGDEADANNTTYYSDKVHPTLLGQYELAPIMAAAIATLAI